MKKTAWMVGVCLLMVMGCSAGKQATETDVPASDARIQYVGRVNFTNPEAPLFTYPGVQIIAGFEGTSIRMKAKPKSALYMGWMGRLKIMFTRQKGAHTADEMWPIYVPGFGTRDNMGWGLSYHLGWKF